jgi:Cu-Zn family superoxide dismutase
MKTRTCSSIIGALLCVSGIAFATPAPNALTVAVNLVDAQGVGASIGTISIRSSKTGIEIVPNLKGLNPGEHGFHIHENPSCAPKEKDGKLTAAMAAGGHFDPHQTGKHMGPHGGGHEGDLPKLEVAADGTTTKAVAVEGVSLADIRNRSIVIHAGGDNYSDTPAPLGGGGARVACGVIPQ